MLGKCETYKEYTSQYIEIENYKTAIEDKTQTWVCHHRLETHFSDGTLRPVNAQLSVEELKELNMYYGRPAEELIFLTRADHNILHNLGKKAGEETRKKLSELAKGRPSPQRGKPSPLKGIPRTEKTRKKLSEILKGKNDWIKGKTWFNNGLINVRRLECPEGFTPGMLCKS